MPVGQELTPASKDGKGDETFDVVIVGGGGAGLAAAIEARAAGRSVLLIEKGATLGGSTALSAGAVTASVTPHQIRRGIKDSPEEHFRDMAEFAGSLRGRDNDGLRRVLCEELPGTFRWLVDLGIRFRGPLADPPHRKPRLHLVTPDARALVRHLGRCARELGADIRLGQRAVRLLRSEERINGVEVEGPAGPMRYRARGGVILAAGDFSSNAELKARYMSVREARAEGLNPLATGDGQSMALAVGAARVVNGDLALGPEMRFATRKTLASWPWLGARLARWLDRLPGVLRPEAAGGMATALAPSPDLFAQGAVLVNAAGARFCDELHAPAHALVDQEPPLGHILIDARIAALFSAAPHAITELPGVAPVHLGDLRRSRPDLLVEAADLDSLAARLGLPSGVLSRTVEGYNARRGQRPRLGFASFAALGPVRPLLIQAEGGLAADMRHRVLGRGFQPIPGLYAAGATGQGGLLLKGEGHHLAWAFVSGRRAGRFAAYEAVSRDLK
jgi:succinate dehydrogenase/fumarate reductase flavoprotein subunit